MTGFPKTVRNMVLARAGGRCERCGMFTDTVQLHHRRPRGMGGSSSPDTNTASNAAALCPGCHTFTESRRADSLFLGFLVRQEQAPADTPIFIDGRWVLLTDDGRAVLRA